MSILFCFPSEKGSTLKKKKKKRRKNSFQKGLDRYAGKQTGGHNNYLPCKQCWYVYRVDLVDLCV